MNLFRSVESGIVWILSSPRMQTIADRLFVTSLKARGFNNYHSPSASGENNFLQWALDSVKEDVFCIDVGANIGAWSLHVDQIARRKGHAAHIWAFEPSSTASRLFEERLPSGSSIRIFRKGLGASVGEAQLRSPIHGSSNASTMDNLSEILCLDQSVELVSSSVLIDTLDNTVALEPTPLPHCHILKIDVEGCELSVIQGSRIAIDTLKPKFIQLEFNRHQLFAGYTLLDLSKLLPEYKLHQIMPFSRGLRERNPSDSGVNMYFWSNWVFVRSI